MLFICQITSSFKKVVKIKSSNNPGVVVGCPYSKDLNSTAKGVLGTIDAEGKH